MSDPASKIRLFESRQVRAEWDAEHEKWWFSVLDIIAVLTDQPDYTKVRNYWKWLKNKLIAEGSQLVSVTNQLKMTAADGKRYKTDVADTEQILRLVQSIPSKRAEPFKLWLAQVGSERLDETVDPELSIDRAIQNYRRLGYSENWINQRIKSIEVRKALTDEWDKSGVQRGQEYAALTDLMSKVWADMTTREYKQHKGLKEENLRDNMTKHRAGAEHAGRSRRHRHLAGAQPAKLRRARAGRGRRRENRQGGAPATGKKHGQARGQPVEREEAGHAATGRQKNMTARAEAKRMIIVDGPNGAGKPAVLERGENT